MLMTTNMKNELRNCVLVSASLSRRISWFSAAVSVLAGGASGTLCSWGAVPHGCASMFNLTPVMHTAGTFPLLLFQGVCPVSLLCSLRMALWSCALNVGSPNGFPMGLGWAVGISPLPWLPLPLLPCCWHPWIMVAHNCCPHVGTTWCKIQGLCFD